MRALFLVGLTLILAFRTAMSQGTNGDLQGIQNGVQFYITGQYDSALVYFERKLLNNPHDTDAIYLTGVCSLNLGHYARAIELLATSATCYRLGMVSHYHLAKAYNQLGLARLALDEANRAVWSDSSFIPAKVELIRAMCASGRVYEAANRVDSTSSLGELTVVGKALLDKRDYDSAIRYLRWALRIDSSSFNNKLLLGDAYYGLGRLKAALSIYTDLFIEFRDSPDLARRLSLCYASADDRGDYFAAIDLMKRYILLSPAASASDFSLIGSWYYKVGKFDSAAAYFSRAITSDSLNSQLYLNLGLALYQLGEVANAEAVLDKALALSNRFLEHVSSILEALGAVRVKEKKFHRAISTYIRAVKIYPQNPEAVYGLARSYDLAGDRQLCIKWYRKFLSHPSSDRSVILLKKAAKSRLQMIGREKQ